MEPNHQTPQKEEKKIKRRYRNYLLQPLLQTKIGLYAIALSSGFTLVLVLILYKNFFGLVNAIVLLTDAEDEVRDLFLDYWYGTQVWIYIAFGCYLAATVVMSIVYTHKLVGPTIAFRRHIRAIIDGELTARTYLRRGDAFREVADELNQLSEVLQQKSASSAKSLEPTLRS